MNLFDRIILPRSTKELIKLNQILEEFNSFMEKKPLKDLLVRLDKIKGYDVELYKKMINTIICQK